MTPSRKYGREQDKGFAQTVRYKLTNRLLIDEPFGIRNRYLLVIQLQIRQGNGRSGGFLAKLNSGVRWNSAFPLTFPDGRKLWIPLEERRLHREKFDSDGCRFLEV